MLRFPISNLAKNAQSHFQPHIHTTFTRLKSGENKKTRRKKRDEEVLKVKGDSLVGGACVSIRLADRDDIISFDL